ncbi:hypothetical protein NYZ99_09815 [Maribacter litopenaei]|uniref:Uncharacterized protein n=1 Tax=Maribacter litopenaei TaxID=2976127 RepID=A0ABY5YC89_9FLAO|nr:hypothetical protein [Maribacter litopenaei]UWX56451.1 hypothetical protein NYZ99_09815 [Maribacter litopenaei]
MRQFSSLVYILFCTVCIAQLDSSQTLSIERQIKEYSKKFDSLFIKSPEKAFDSMKEAMRLAQKSEHPYALAEASFQYGRYYLDKSMSDSASYYFNTADKKFREMDSLFKPKLIQYYLASVENLRANYAGALELIAKNLLLKADNRKDSLLKLRYINLNATVYSNLDDQKKVLKKD